MKKKILDTLLNSLKKKKKKWHEGSFCLYHENGFAFWIGNGFLNLHCYSPIEYKFNLFQKIKIWRAIKKWKEDLIINKMKDKL